MLDVRVASIAAALGLQKHSLSIATFVAQHGPSLATVFWVEGVASAADEDKWC